MNLTFNGIKPININFNDESLETVTCNGVTVWLKEQEDTNDYLCFTSSGTSTISMTFTGLTSSNFSIYYSSDKKEWTKWNYSKLTLTDGQKLYFYGENPLGFLTSTPGTARNAKFVMTGKIYGSGDACFLLSKDISKKTNLPTCAFNSLFYGCSSLITAPNISLNIGGSNTRIFYNCTNMIKGPERINITGGGWQCQYMFSGCSKLTETPYIYGVDSGIGATSSMYGMFLRCSLLNKVIIESNYSISSSNWLSGVASTGTFYRLGKYPTSTGTSGIPSGWTVKTSLD